MPAGITNTADALIPVRFIVKGADGQPLTNTNASDVPLSEIAASIQAANQQPAQANSTAVDVAALNVQFNNLLAKLRDAGILAT